MIVRPLVGLGLGATADPTVIPMLIAALHDPQQPVRLNVMHALSRIGPPARAAIPILRDILDDPQEARVVHTNARYALQRIAGKE